MLAALIYHKADAVPTDIVSISIDVLPICLLMFLLCVYFTRASLKRSKTAGILECSRRLFARLNRLLRCPLLYGVALSVLAGLHCPPVAAPAFLLPGMYSIPCYWYVVPKAVFCMLLGGGFTALTLYSGMCKA